MNTIRNIPGIYAWTDVSRNKNVFKLGCASDILYRIQGEERKETSNIGTIKILFILECSHGNEKQFETGHITIGAYCVNVKEYSKYLKWATKESMLDYYNQCKNVNVVYSKNHSNLGDINSYIENLWLL